MNIHTVIHISDYELKCKGEYGTLCVIYLEDIMNKNQAVALCFDHRDAKIKRKNRCFAYIKPK